MELRVDVPQFLDAQAIDLRVAVLREVEGADHFLCEVSAATLCEEGIFGVEFEAGLVIGLVRAVARDAHVAGRDAHHPALIVEQDFGGGEAGEDFDAEFFGLAREPAAQVAEAAGIGALVVQERRRQRVRQDRLLLFRQHPVEVFGYRHFGERAVLPPVGQQFVEAARIDHRTRQDVRADLGALFEHADAEVRALFGRHLFEPDRRRQARRAGADDHHVVRHRFTLRHCHPLPDTVAVVGAGG